MPLTGEMVRRREEQKRLQQRRRTWSRHRQPSNSSSATEKRGRKKGRSKRQLTQRQPTPAGFHKHSPSRIILISDSAPTAVPVDRVRVALDEDDGSQAALSQGREDVLALLESLQHSSPRPPSPLFAPPLHPSPHSVFTPSPLHPRAVTPTRHSSTRAEAHAAEVTEEQKARRRLRTGGSIWHSLNEQVDAMHAEGVTAATPRQRQRTARQCTRPRPWR